MPSWSPSHLADSHSEGVSPIARTFHSSPELERHRGHARMALTTSASREGASSQQETPEASNGPNRARRASRDRGDRAIPGDRCGGRTLEPIPKLGEWAMSLPPWGHGMATAHGRAMDRGAPGAPASQAQSEGRPAAGGRSAVLRRHSLDPLDGGALERAAPAVRQPDDLLVPAQTVGGELGIARAVAGAAPAAE